MKSNIQKFTLKINPSCGSNTVNSLKIKELNQKISDIFNYESGDFILHKIQNILINAIKQGVITKIIPYGGILDITNENDNEISLEDPDLNDMQIHFLKKVLLSPSFYKELNYTLSSYQLNIKNKKKTISTFKYKTNQTSQLNKEESEEESEDESEEFYLEDKEYYNNGNKLNAEEENANNNAPSTASTASTIKSNNDLFIEYEECKKFYIFNENGINGEMLIESAGSNSDLD